MNKHVAWYIFSIGAIGCASLYEIRKAYESGLEDGEKIGRISGVHDLVETIHIKWKTLRDADIGDSLLWLNAVVESVEVFSGENKKKEDYDEQAKKEFMKAAAEAQERLMTS